MDIDVIIPTYNRVTLVQRAIASALAAGASHVIVCDDGSTDGTIAAVSQLSRKNRKIIFESLPHTGGPAIPRNFGIRRSRADWVAFLDSDDLWHPTKLTKQLNYAREGNFDLVCSNAHQLVGNEKKPYFSPSLPNCSYNFVDLLSDNKIICSSVLVKRAALLSVDLFPPDPKYIAIEDYLTWLKIATQYTIGYLSAPLLTYTDTPSATIRSRWAKPVTQKQAVRQYILPWVIKRPGLYPNLIKQFISIAK